jgi:hypothetical protein
MENYILLGLGIPFAVCGLISVVLFFKLNKEAIPNVPFLIKFFGIHMFFSKYLTERGVVIRKRYWLMCFVSFLLAVSIVIAMTILIPEFGNDMVFNKGVGS